MFPCTQTPKTMAALKRNVGKIFHKLGKSLCIGSKNKNAIQTENASARLTVLKPVIRLTGNPDAHGGRKWWQIWRKQPKISKKQERLAIMHNLEHLYAFRNELIDAKLECFFVTDLDSGNKVQWSMLEEKILERVEQIIWENRETLNATYDDDRRAEQEANAAIQNNIQWDEMWEVGGNENFIWLSIEESENEPASNLASVETPATDIVGDDNKEA